MSSSFDIIIYQQLLLNWFTKNGRHDLPWQGDFNPYHVWLSEVMLQQTQVKTVIPYFSKFIKAFPKVSDLARVEQDEVMQYWAGLGYYARARNLHKAAKIICVKYAGSLPDNVNDLRLLPGVGQSTANAILSIAFNKPTPILDGNVKRVFSRLFVINEILAQPKIEKSLWQLAVKLMPKKNTQAYTQAQMDLGATVCIRTKPKCNICPLQNICLSFLCSTVEKYPLKKPKVIKKIKSAVFYLYQYQDELLLIRKPNKGIWGGLYVLPENNLNFGNYSHMLCEGQKHVFTHFVLYYDIKVFQVESKLAFENVHWVAFKNIVQYALPSLFSKHLL